MLQAMLAGVSSIRAHQIRLNVIGNNLANVNTTAFKSSRVGFQELLAQTMRAASRPSDSVGGSNPLQFGLGVRVASAETTMDQGSLQSTTRSTDFALQGQGFFMLTNGARTAYTRDGSFDIDADGTMVHSGTGEKMLGWSADENGDIQTTGQVTSLNTITIPIGILTSVQKSTRSPFAGNLDSRSLATDSRSVDTVVYDSLGGEHQVTVTYSNHQTGTWAAPAPATATARWEWAAYEDGVQIGGTNFPVASPEGDYIYFNSDGQFVTADPAPTQSMTVTPTNGSTAFSVAMDFNQLQQVEAVTNVQAGQPNGFRPGTLASFTVSLDGTVHGQFTNGYSRPLGRIALAVFANPGGMEKIGNNMYRQSDNSGIPSIGAPTENGRAEVNVGFLEMSNVDIGDQFTSMIVTQRGFQANTRVVTTVDEMMQEVLNMKR